MKEWFVQTLQSERLILRPLTLNDAPCLFNQFASDPQVTHYLSWKPHQNVEETTQIIQQWLDQKTNIFAIENKNTHEIMGTINVANIDQRTLSCEIGYALGSRFWNHGYMTEALNCLLHYLFDEVGFNRVRADCDARNKASSAVMKKCGMKFELCKLQNVWSNAGIGDREIYAILKGDQKANHFYS